MRHLLILTTLIALVIAVSGCVYSSAKEQACIDSGGTVATGLCCLQTEDFPNTCLIGACGCSPDNSHNVKICDCGEGCWDGKACTQYKNCEDDSDCAVFGESGDCNCGCFNKDYEWEKEGDCFCAAPLSCRCSDGVCEGLFEEHCVNNDECVPATCCHPSECVLIDEAPDCELISCTQECSPGTMDCGCGHCACIDNECQVEWTREAGDWCLP